MQTDLPLLPVMSGKTDTGIGLVTLVKDFQNILVQVSSASNANFTLKFQISLSDDAPAFGSAASVSNHWDYVESYDLNSTASPVVGSTGVVTAGTDIVKNYMINTNFAKWFSARITAISAGAVTVKVLGVNY